MNLVEGFHIAKGGHAPEMIFDEPAGSKHACKTLGPSSLASASHDWGGSGSNQHHQPRTHLIVHHAQTAAKLDTLNEGAFQANSHINQMVLCWMRVGESV